MSPAEAATFTACAVEFVSVAHFNIVSPAEFAFVQFSLPCLNCTSDFVKASIDVATAKCRPRRSAEPNTLVLDTLPAAIPTAFKAVLTSD